MSGLMRGMKMLTRILDSICYKVEQLAKVFHKIAVNKKDDIPDIELMIAAENQHLYIENKQLKKKQYPSRLVKNDKDYLCPDCNYHIRVEMAVVDRIKYCPECGKRIYVNYTDIGEEQEKII